MLWLELCQHLIEVQSRKCVVRRDKSVLTTIYLKLYLVLNINRQNALSDLDNLNYCGYHVSYKKQEISENLWNHEGKRQMEM